MNGHSNGHIREVATMKTHLLVLSLLVIPATQVRGQPAGALAPRAERFFKAHCIRCHGAEKQEGEFRIDTLSSRVGFEDTPQWVEIMERINSGEMPPEDVPNPPDAELKTSIVEWIAGRMKEGEAAQMAKRDRVSYRRLTREKYVCTMRTHNKSQFTFITYRIRHHPIIDQGKFRFN